MTTSPCTPVTFVADLLDRLVELGLAAAGDEDVSPFGDEPLGRGQADAAVAAGDDRDLAFELPHVVEPPV